MVPLSCIMVVRVFTSLIVICLVSNVSGFQQGWMVRLYGSRHVGLSAFPDGWTEMMDCIHLSLQDKTFESVVLRDNQKLDQKSLNRTGLDTLKQATSRLVAIKAARGAPVVQVRYQHTKTDMFKNYSPKIFVEEIIPDLVQQTGFQKLSLRYQNSSILSFHFKRSRERGVINVKAMHMVTSESNKLQGFEQQHDRVKDYFIPLSAPFLEALGITSKVAKSSSGKGLAACLTTPPKVVAGMQDKYKQINSFVAILARVLRQFDGDTKASPTSSSSQSFLHGYDGLEIIDMGCGKAYLTFAVHHYFQELISQTSENGIQKTLKTIGMDMQPQLIAQNRAIARSLGPAFETLHFSAGKIGEQVASDVTAPDCTADCFTSVHPQVSIHNINSSTATVISKPSVQAPRRILKVLLALHACDTATDDALHYGIANDMDLLVTAPCCHQELRPHIDAFHRSHRGSAISASYLPSSKKVKKMLSMKTSSKLNVDIGTMDRTGFDSYVLDGNDVKGVRKSGKVDTDAELSTFWTSTSLETDADDSDLCTPCEDIDSSSLLAQYVTTDVSCGLPGTVNTPAKVDSHVNANGNADAHFLADAGLLAMLSHGIYRTRLSAMLTDTLRAEILRYAGYDEVNIQEFVDVSHTVQNTLIIARRSDRDSSISSRRSRAVKEVDDLGASFEAEKSMSTRLSKPLQEGRQSKEELRRKQRVDMHRQIQQTMRSVGVKTHRLWDLVQDKSFSSRG